MSFSVVAKGQKKPNKPEAKNANAGAKGKAKEMNTKIDALSTLKVKQNGAELLSYSIADQKNHTGKKFTNEEDKEYTVFVKDINAETVTVSVKGPGVFESKPISRSPTASPAGGAQPSPSINVLGFEFSLSGPVPVKKATGLM